MSPQETKFYEAQQELASARKKYEEAIGGGISDLQQGIAVEEDRAATIEFANVCQDLGKVVVGDFGAPSGQEAYEQPIAA